MEYINNENFQFVIVEVKGYKKYGFDMRNIKQNETAENIVSNNWTYASMEDNINGWKIARELPSWVKGHVDWHKFVQKENQLSDNDIDNIEDKEEYEYKYEDDEEQNFNLKQNSSESDDDEYEDKSSKKGEHFENILDNNKSEEDINKLQKRKSNKTDKSNEDILSSEDDYNEHNKRICTSLPKSFNENIESEEDNNNNESYISRITSTDMDSRNNHFDNLFDSNFMSNFE